MNLKHFVFAVGLTTLTFTWIGINKIFLSSVLNALKQKSTADYHRAFLELLVRLSFSKEYIDVELTNNQVKTLSDEDVEKYYKRCITFMETYETSGEQE